MNRIDEALEQLLGAVKDSSEYKEYCTQLQRVKQDSDLKMQIDDFRRKNFDLQKSSDCSFEQMERFQQEYSSFRENLLVSDFLASELALCRMMQHINLQLTDALNFE